jgi:hypothetical protein
MPHMLQIDNEADVQIIPIYPDVQIIPVKSSEPDFPSESTPVLIIELGRRTTLPTLKTPKGAEWIVEQAAGDDSEIKKRTV